MCWIALGWITTGQGKFSATCGRIDVVVFGVACHFSAGLSPLPLPIELWSEFCEHLYFRSPPSGSRVQVCFIRWPYYQPSWPIDLQSSETNLTPESGVQEGDIGAMVRLLPGMSTDLKFWYWLCVCVCDLCSVILRNVCLRYAGCMFAFGSSKCVFKPFNSVNISGSGIFWMMCSISVRSY